MAEGPADPQGLGPLLEHDRAPSGQGSLESLHTGDVDQGLAVDLPELAGIKVHQTEHLGQGVELKILTPTANRSMQTLSKQDIALRDF